MIDYLHDLLKNSINSAANSYFRRKLRKAALKQAKMQALEQNNFVYQPEKTRSKFYLPFYKTEFIQQLILTRRNYYDFSGLNYVTSVAMGGAVLERIKGNTILDIGANIGNHTLYFLSECGVGKVHCFEPMDKVYDVLLKNIEINNYLDKAILHKVGVGAISSKASLIKFEDANMGSTQIGYNEKGDIPIVAIDDIGFDEPVSLIKVDVEGFEYEVIKGMVDTVKTNKPYILIEIRKEFFDEIDALLKSLGYWYINISGGMNYLYIPQ